MKLQAWTVIIEYSSTYFSLQADPRHCFHTASPEWCIDECRELGTLAVFTALASIPKSDEDCSLQHLTSLLP